MSQYNVTNPQPSSPLNLLYKGAFSTRFSKRNKSRYGHYLDKLYQVLFLGIGTHRAEILPDIVNAVMLRQSSIDSKVDVYKMTRDKYSESLVLEALGGGLVGRTSELAQDSKSALRLDEAVPADILDIVSATSLIVQFDTIELLSTLQSARIGEILDVIASELEKGAVTSDVIAARRLDRINDAVINLTMPSMTLPNDWMIQHLDHITGESSVGAAEINVKYNLSNRYLKQIDDLPEAAKARNVRAFDTVRYGKGMDSFTTQALELMEYMSRNIRGGEMVDLSQFKTSGEGASALQVFTNVDRLKIKLAEYSLDVIAKDFPVNESVLMVTDVDTLAILLRSADVATEAAIAAERAGRQAIINLLNEAVNTKTAAAVHYLLYNRDQSYRRALETTIAKYVDSTKVSMDTVYKVIQELAKEVDEVLAAQKDGDYLDAEKVLLGHGAEEVTVSRLVKEITRELAGKFDGLAAQKQLHAVIPFDHEVRAEESVRFIDLLDTMYQDFKMYLDDNTRVLNVPFVGGNLVTRGADMTLLSAAELDSPRGEGNILRQVEGSPVIREVEVIEPSSFRGQQGSTLMDVLDTYISERTDNESLLIDYVISKEADSNKSTLSNDNYFGESLRQADEQVAYENMTPSLTIVGNIETLLTSTKTVGGESAVEEDVQSITNVGSDTVILHEYEDFSEVAGASILHRYEIGEQSQAAVGQVDTYTSAEETPVGETVINTDILIDHKVATPMSVLDHDMHGEFSGDEPSVFTVDSRDEELWAEFHENRDPIIPTLGTELVSAELSSTEQVLVTALEVDLWGELSADQERVVPETETDLWGELTDSEHSTVFSLEPEVFGELTGEHSELYPEFSVAEIAVRVNEQGEGFVQNEYDIAVLSCSNPNLKYRRRPDLVPDPEPEDPLFEWICTEGFVCDDWLIVPLKDFNFENPEVEGFYDPNTFEPYFPTGQTDEDGDPYVLPPYSILNEPISNGADVGGKFPMSIDPCNLYSFIHYTVKIYDSYKARFHASSPIDTISRVMNLLFEQVQKLNAAWDESKGYTPDELWRIYRFIRWMALGITNRFYRVKIEYTYGDFSEQFEVYPFSDKVSTEGAARKYVEGHGWVMEGHPLLETMKNKARFDFKLPQKTRSSTVSFELGNKVPDRPDMISVGGTLFYENFEGVASSFEISGDGWIPVPTQGGISLGVESPAKVKTYRTSSFNVPANAVTPSLQFNYGLDTNMDTKLLLKRSNGTVVWQSSGNTTFAPALLSPVPAGDYYFEVRVPQSESDTMTDMSFTATQIQNEWQKVGYQTEWKVTGNVIKEDENTPGMAMVINPQWVQDSDYEMEVEFHTEDIPANYGLIDFIGIVLNYKDAGNYYLFGTWSDLDPHAKSGLTKVVNGVGATSVSNPSFYVTPDFRFKLGHWHKIKAVVKGNNFKIYVDGTKYIDLVDPRGWGFGASGLAAYSNPKSSFRNFKYRSKPRFSTFIDNVKVEAPALTTPVAKPKYAIDFFLDGETPRIADYLSEGKRAYSFPILVGEHHAEWVFKKVGSENSIPQDASFIDNIVVKGMKVVKAEVVEEFIGCGGHFAVKLLIENLLEYYRRHHQGCKGRRDIWIIE